jgi:hypothetical protein
MVKYRVITGCLTLVSNVLIDDADECVVGTTNIIEFSNDNKI